MLKCNFQCKIQNLHIQGLVSRQKYRLTRMGNPVLKKRRPTGHLSFNMGVAHILAR